VTAITAVAICQTNRLRPWWQSNTNTHLHTFVSQFSIGVWAFEPARKFICLCWAIGMGISIRTQIWMRNHNRINVCDLKGKTYAPAQW